MKIAINVDNLSFYYGEKKALKDINMQIEENKVIALIGPSGCGKSTFLRCLNRMNDLIDNTSYKGNIDFYGEKILEIKDVTKLRRNIGMVFQKPNPFPKSIYENIIYGPKRLGKYDKKALDELVEKSIEDVGLTKEVEGKLKQSAFDLSGGQQQRLCIARAIAASPKVILMDEPTSALDPASTKKIEQLILKLKKNYTVVIVTHDMGQAYRVSDYTGFFLNGDLVEFDKTENIFKSPKERETRDYVNGIFG
ncbi:MAG: phosphate ABC transporter ATP-binding protein PstB [Sarcina sp.]